MDGAAFVVARKKAEEKVGGLARLRRRADDGAIVLAQHLQPGTDVVGMAHGRHDAERGAAEGGIHLRHQLLERIFLGAEGAGEIAVQPVRGAAGVTELMQRGAVPVDRLEIGLRRRHLHIVVRWCVEGAAAADAEVDARRLDQRLDRGLDQAGLRRRRGDSEISRAALRTAPG